MARWFVLVTFFLTWLLIGGFAWLGGQWGSNWSIPIGILMMFIPAMVAMVIERRRGGSLKQLAGLQLRANWWWLLAWLLPLAIALAAFGVALLFPDIALDTSVDGFLQRFEDTLSPQQLSEAREALSQLPLHPFWLGIPQALMLGATINAIPAWGEEVGWRSFLYRELEHWGFWKASFTVGIIWGVWHAPAIMLGHNYPDHPWWGVLMMIVYCILMAPIIQHVRNKAGSVIAAAIFHGVVNASWGLSVMQLGGGSDLLIGVTGLAGLMVLALLDLGLFFWRRRK